MGPTLRDRFQGALMGSLLGPIYVLQVCELQHGRSPLLATDSADLPPADLPPVALPPVLWAGERLKPTVEALLALQWEVLAAAGQVLFSPSLSARSGAQPAPEQVRIKSGQSAGQQLELDKQGFGMALPLLSYLPAQLLQRNWQADGQRFVGAALWTEFLLDAPLLPEQQAQQEETIVALDQWMTGTQLSLAALDWSTALGSWFHFIHGQSTQAASVLPGAERLILGSQLLGLALGAQHGIRAIPWAAKRWLGEVHPALLGLGDRLYGAWAGQVDLQSLGVSCQRGVITAISFP